MEILLVVVFIWNIPGIFHIPEKFNIIMLSKFSGIFHFVKFHIRWHISGIFGWNIPSNIPSEYSWNIPRNMKFHEMEYSRKIAQHDNVELFWNMEYSWNIP